jgi:tyrosyl-tRNA synthetase
MNNVDYINKFEIITKDLEEVIGEDMLKDVLKTRNLKLYWGTATTGKPHIGYLMPLLKIKDFLDADCQVTILFADLHAYLDALKSTEEQLNYRVKYYTYIIKETLYSLGISRETIETNINFVRGTEYQLTSKYTMDVYRLNSKTSLRDATKAGAEVVKQSNNPKMASLLYPGLQVLDEEYLGVDCQFGGIDQRKIFMMAEKYLPMMGYKKRIHLMNPMIKSFNEDTDGKMSSSDINTKIDLNDSSKQIKKKIGRAFCPEKSIDTGLFQFFEKVIYKILCNRNETILFERPEEYGGNLQCKNIGEVKEQILLGNIHPVDLKNFMSNFLVNLLEPIRLLSNNKDFLESEKKGY